ncbi:MAG: class I SAM-dependent methyltransferase [Magnetococcus sp. THC-1_WYH]
MPPIIPETHLTIWPIDPLSKEKATRWSLKLGLPLVDHPPISSMDTPILAVDQGRLEFRLGTTPQKGIFAEFSAHKTRIIQRQEGKNGLLARAVGLRKLSSPRILDATAGLGHDSFLLASYGCQVQSFERSPWIAALLEDAMERGYSDPETREILEQRMTLHSADAVNFLRQPTTTSKVDVVYLDPMFTKNKRSALSRKEMQLLRLLVGQDEDAPQLLHAARAYKPRRVVVKRPVKAPVIEGDAPHFSITGTTIRYDVYLPEV